MDNLDFNLEETEKKVTFIFQTMLPILLPTKKYSRAANQNLPQKPSKENLKQKVQVRHTLFSFL